MDGETGMMPTGTTPSEFMLLVCLTVGCAVMDYVLRLAGWMRESQAASFWEWSTRHRPERKPKGVEALGAVREFYRSPVAFLIVWLPWLAYCCGNIVISLLRDVGVMIFPWPIAINGGLLGVWWSLSSWLKFRRMSRMVGGEGPQEPFRVP